MRVHRKSWTRPKMIAFGALALALFLIIVYVFSSVRVRITPKQTTRQISVTLRAQAAPGASLPAEIMRIPMTLEDSVSTTGERMVREPAHGTVVIYNAFSSEAQPLVRRTRFKTAEGKIYRTEHPVTVPGVRVENGEVVPGSVEAQVVADEPGSAYNIGLVDFTVPGFAGTPRYEKFYARSKTPMAGGHEGVAKVATAADVTRLRSALEERLREALLVKADAQIPDGFLRPADGTEMTIVVSKMEPEVDKAGETLSMTLEGALSAFIIRKDDFAAALLGQELRDGLGKDVANLSELALRVETRNFEKKELVFAVSGNAHIVWQTADDAQLKRELIAAGGAYETVFKKYPAITRAQITFSPSWWRLFPRDTDDIIIERVTDETATE